MLHIVMDSAGDIPSDWANEFDIQIIPINIQFKEQTYLQGVDLTDEGFYQLVDKTGVIPKTSQPTPQQFIDFYQRIAKSGDTILSIHITQKLSGTFESAILAARELLGKFNVIPFDSAAGSAAMGYMCKEARLLERAGASIERIMKRLEFIRQNIGIILTLDTLDYARMSGRVKTLQAAFASLLNVKPIVKLHEGVLYMADKVRTRGKSISYILDRASESVADRLVNAAVVHARDLQAGKSLMDRVRQRFKCKELILTDLSISLAANLGPGTLGIITYPVEE